MVVLSIANVPLHYTPCQCCHMPFLLLLTVVSVHQYMVENLSHGLNATEKRFPIQLTLTVQLPGVQFYDT